MAMSVGAAGGESGPMNEINTTSLIDVMLVLLIMFILTVPIQTHGVNIDVPRAPPPSLPLPPPPLKNVVTIDPHDQVAVERVLAVPQCPGHDPGHAEVALDPGGQPDVAAAEILGG